MSVTQTAVLSAWLFLGCALGAPAAAACSDVETCSSSSSSSSSRASQENILLQTERAEASGAADREMNHQEASVAQKIAIQTDASVGLPSGEYTIQQKQTWKYLDAYTTNNDYRAVIRTRQTDNSQLWKIVNLGSGTYTLQQKQTYRYLDAYTTNTDYRAVTRTAQGDDSQLWFIRSDRGYYNIQQKQNNRYLDAYTANNDYQAVTRTAQGDDSQRWHLRMVTALRSTGEWESVHSCANCPTGINYASRVETTNSAGSSTVVTNEREVTGTIGAAFKFMSVEVSATVRTSVARETTQQLTKVNEETVNIHCDRDPTKRITQLWRWVVISDDIRVKTSDFTCHQSEFPMKPKCPYGSCSDELCQVCRPWKA